MLLIIHLKVQDPEDNVLSFDLFKLFTKLFYQKKERKKKM